MSYDIDYFFFPQPIMVQMLNRSMIIRKVADTFVIVGADTNKREISITTAIMIAVRSDSSAKPVGRCLPIKKHCNSIGGLLINCGGDILESLRLE